MTQEQLDLPRLRELALKMVDIVGFDTSEMREEDLPPGLVTPLYRVWATVAMTCGGYDETPFAASMTKTDAEYVTALLPATVLSLLDLAESAGRLWQPIETAPKDGTTFLAWWDAPDVPNEARHRLQHTRWGRQVFDETGEEDWIISLAFPPKACRPTHWMPFPAPPALSPAQSTEGEEGQ